MTTNRFCEQCGSDLSASARFCPNCGFALAGIAPATASPTGPGAPAVRERGLARIASWLVPTIAVVAALAFAIVSARDVPPETGQSIDGMGGTASDISALSADERVDRLFNRVMAAAAAGKMDTVAFFAPMAVSSFEALAPLTPHRRYDLGLLHLVSGSPALARAEADTILAAAPNHLLGLALAMRSAAAAGDDGARRRFAARFLQQLSAERARQLPEYTDHATDIDDARLEAEGRTKGAASAPARP